MVSHYKLLCIHMLRDSRGFFIGHTSRHLGNCFLKIFKVGNYWFVKFLFTSRLDADLSYLWCVLSSLQVSLTPTCPTVDALQLQVGLTPTCLIVDAFLKVGDLVSDLYCFLKILSSSSVNHVRAHSLAMVAWIFIILSHNDDWPCPHMSYDNDLHLTFDLDVAIKNVIWVSKISSSRRYSWFSPKYF